MWRRERQVTARSLTATTRFCGGQRASPITQARPITCDLLEFGIFLHKNSHVFPAKARARMHQGKTHTGQVKLFMNKAALPLCRDRDRDPPLWGMPSTTLSTPSSALRSMMVFMPGMRVSQPSRPKRFALVCLFARKLSNSSLHASLSMMFFFCWTEYWGCEGGDTQTGDRGQTSLKRRRHEGNAPLWFPMHLTDRGVGSRQKPWLAFGNARQGCATTRTGALRNCHTLLR